MILRDVIICLGDSLTYGSRDNPEGAGYPARLAPLIEEETGKLCVCLNKGVTKEVSTETMNRTYDVVRSYPEAQLVLLMTGTNDLKGIANMSAYSQNMERIINAIKICGKKIIVGTLPPVDTMGMWCFPRNVNWGVAKYNEIICDLGMKVIDFSDMKDYLIDGVHFSPDGYGEMARRWFNGIKDLL